MSVPFCDHCNATDKPLEIWPEESLRLCPACAAHYRAYGVMDTTCIDELQPVLRAFIQRGMEVGVSDGAMLDILDFGITEAVSDVLGDPPWKIKENIVYPLPPSN